MSIYTTGELAKRCGVTVRTVQYYDMRGILVPSELSEGGRRLYSEDDLRRMKVICFLRETGLSIDTIGKLLAEEHPEAVIALLLDQQTETVRAELDESRQKLDKLETLRRELQSVESFSVESIGDIAYTMQHKDKLKKMYRTLLLSAVPVCALEIAGILLWIFSGIWWVFALYAALAVPYAILMSRYYYRRVAYICPQCHTVFKPTFREMVFASHTMKTRKLTCTSCGHRGFCVETWGGDGE